MGAPYVTVRLSPAGIVPETRGVKSSSPTNPVWALGATGIFANVVVMLVPGSWAKAAAETSRINPKAKERIFTDFIYFNLL